MTASTLGIRLQIRLLGGFRLLYDGEPVEKISQPRQQSLFAYLVLHRGAAQSRRQIAFALWPDTSEAQAHTNLRRELYHLRRALPQAEQFLQIGQRTLDWSGDAPYELDVARFEEHTAQARAAAQQARPDDELVWLERALECYPGDLLPDCYDDWIQDERERLRQSSLQALERAADLLEAQGRIGDAIRYTELWVRRDRFEERAYRCLMQLHLHGGDRGSGLRVYHACVAMLEEDLGALPAAATRAIYHRLIQEEEGPRLPVKERTDRGAETALVGRREEWQALQQIWAVAQAGKPHFACLVGEPGIGKSRLAEELLLLAQRGGVAAAYARAYAAEGQLAYDPITVWLRAAPVEKRRQGLEDVWLMETARLLPELAAEHPAWPALPPMTESWQRRRLHEALARAFLAAPDPLLLVLDDLQWCDRETLEWLRYLLRFDPRAPLLVVGTARSGEVDDDHPYTALRRELLQSGQWTELELGPLGLAETAKLLEQVAGRAPDADQMAAFHRVTAGNPLFAEEMARAGLVSRVTQGQPPIVRPPLPSKVQAVIEARLARLSPAARNLATLAATVGRAFALDVLQHAAAEAEGALLVALEELWQRRIVREQEQHCYDFSHDLIREVAYSSLGPARRALFHRQVAQALERLHAGDLDAVSGQIADHYERAGLPEVALPYYERAAFTAQRVYAHVEARHYLTCGLTILQGLTVSESRLGQELRLQLALSLSLAHLQGSSSAEQLATLERADALSLQVGDDRQRLVVLDAKALSYFNQGQIEQANIVNQRTLALARRVADPWYTANISVLRGSILEHLGQWRSSQAQLESIVAETTNQGANPAGLQRVHHPGVGAHRHLGLVLWHLGYPDQARRRMDEALSLAQETDHLFTQVSALVWSAWLALNCGNALLAQRQAEEARVLSTQWGYTYRLGHSRAFLGAALVEQGQVAQGIDLIRAGLDDHHALNARVHRPVFLGLLAEACGQAGQPERGLPLLEEALSLATDGGIRSSLAELYRLQGVLLCCAAKDAAAVESCFVQALEIAREQEAKSLELRAALDLSRFWRGQDRICEAHTLLAEIYGWFTEGFETRDLQEARALLADLA